MPKYYRKSKKSKDKSRVTRKNKQKATCNNTTIKKEFAESFM